MTTAELTRMAARGEEDGYERAWMAATAQSRRNLDLMLRAADAAKEAAKQHEAAFVPTTKPSSKKP